MYKYKYCVIRPKITARAEVQTVITTAQRICLLFSGFDPTGSHLERASNDKRKEFALKLFLHLCRVSSNYFFPDCKLYHKTVGEQPAR